MNQDAADVVTCLHEQFAANVAVNRLEDVGLFSADITIRCAQCGEDFGFVGLEAGYSPTEPRVSIDGLTLIAPIEPGLRLRPSASFVVPTRPKES